MSRDDRKKDCFKITRKRFESQLYIRKLIKKDKHLCYAFCKILGSFLKLTRE